MGEYVKYVYIYGIYPLYLKDTENVTVVRFQFVLVKVARDLNLVLVAAVVVVVAACEGATERHPVYPLLRLVRN